MFSFKMAALSFDYPENNNFAYRLENFDDQWNYINNRPFASYTNVPPGDYVLHVIAANNDGIWNREGYRLPVTIRAPFWQTWWFRITALVTIIALTVIITRNREKKLTKEQQEKSELRERIAASEMRALRSQMNPHFLYNSLNAIRLFVLQNDSDNADKYLVKFARLMRLILDNSRQEWVPLSSELECVIDDDGVGRQKAMLLKSQSTVAHKSVGLKVTEDRLQLISERSGQKAGVSIIDKQDDDGQPTGTRVVIQLPLITQ